MAAPERPALMMTSSSPAKAGPAASAARAPSSATKASAARPNDEENERAGRCRGMKALLLIVFTPQSVKSLEAGEPLPARTVRGRPEKIRAAREVSRAARYDWAQSRTRGGRLRTSGLKGPER